MFPPLKEIKRRRKILEITQTGLSQKSGVSQSLIAKIEAGKAEPSYSSAKKIFEALDSIEAKTGITAKDIMNTRVVSVQKNEPVSHAIAVMKRFNVSQIPVMSGDALSGSISEKSVLDRIAGGEKDVALARIDNIMDDAYPTVGENAPLTTVIALLQHSQAVLVVKKEHVSGIITKADIFKIIKP